MVTIYGNYHDALRSNNGQSSYGTKQCWFCACARRCVFSFILVISLKFLNWIPAFSCHDSSPLSNHLEKRQQQYPCFLIMWFTFDSSSLKSWDKKNCEPVRFYCTIIANIWCLALRRLFEKIICFADEDFQPSATHKFFMDWALSHFVFERQKLESFLRDHQGLGAHTDIVQFQPTVTTTFRWTHPGARPFGNDIRKQCPGCGRLKTRSPNLDVKGLSIRLQCSKCKYYGSTYDFPAGWDWVHSAPVKGDGGQGAWLHQIE